MSEDHAELVIRFIYARINEGATAEQIVADLVLEGWSPHDAVEVVEAVAVNLRSHVGSATSRTSSDPDWSLNSASTGSFIIAAIAAAIGGGLTLGTYSAATAEGGSGSYYIFWGAAVFGGVAWIQGVAKLGSEGRASAGSLALAAISLAVILASAVAILATL